MPSIDFPIVPPVIIVELVPEWYADFINLSPDELREIIRAAHQMHIKPLGDLIYAIMYMSTHDCDYLDWSAYFAATVVHP
eukprot:scaffold33334_cov100-Skeletonema_dohrnii-CCMP3373.AAC.1